MDSIYDYSPSLVDCVVEKDTLRFKQLLDDMVRFDDFLASLEIAKALACSPYPKFNNLLALALDTHIEWAIVSREEYGQPLFREILREGEMDYFSCYCEKLGKSLKEIAPELLSFGWHKLDETLDSTDVLPDPLPLLHVANRRFASYILSERDYDEVWPTVQKLDLALRQWKILKKLEAVLS